MIHTAIRDKVKMLTLNQPKDAYTVDSTLEQRLEILSIRYNHNQDKEMKRGCSNSAAMAD